MKKKISYDRFPCTEIACEGNAVFAGYPAIVEILLARCRKRKKTVIAVELYPGTDKEEVRGGLFGLLPELVLDAEECAFSPDELDRVFAPNLTDDRVFGRMICGDLAEYFLPEKIADFRRKIAQVEEGIVLVFGTGASLVTEGDILIYGDIARWEIQLRYRAGMPNWRCENNDAPVLAKYKRGFFIEWRLADRLKAKLLPKIDYLLDTNQKGEPKLLEGQTFRQGLKTLANRPFRLVPYFDPGVWGGQWMKEICGLEPEEENYAWSFDGVPEENSLYLSCNGIRVEIPAMDLVLAEPSALLGERVHARFGREFPIRFDFLDTIGGQNLSLQVHPLTEYIQTQFGMHYTQDESYYILDTAEEEAAVYLGVKNGIDKESMMQDLRRAEKGEIPFPAEEYINRIPVKKHDHVLIPAGTIHCSGAGAMVLEISATPYIFTFKLWDWGRLGLDGLPRPIHLDHGFENIQWNRDTEWVMKELVGQGKLLADEEGCRTERTGLHQREFIETKRFTFNRPVYQTMKDSVHMLNLVDGEEVSVVSPAGVFPPFCVHYAETFIIPAAVEEYLLVPSGPSKGKEVMVIQASVRG